MTAQSARLAAYVEDVVYDYATEVDPDELRWPDCDSLAPLEAELRLVIEGRVADWLIEQKEGK